MVWSPANDPPKQGGPHPAIRPDDGRTMRSDCSRRNLSGRVLDKLIDKGDFHPKLDAIAWAADRGRSVLQSHFGTRRLLFAHLARIAPARVVDAIGLTPEARSALSERDERAIAMAVLAGRRLERGE
jgi:hypothetical protein